jgi:hypothetical protein
MKTQSIIELVTTIEEKTQKGELRWQIHNDDVFSTNPSSFKTDLGNYTISIRENKNVSGQDSPDYYLTIGLASGSELESFSDGELTQMANKERTSFQSFSLMQSIYKNARRQVMGVDTAIDNILSALKKTP